MPKRSTIMVAACSLAVLLSAGCSGPYEPRPVGVSAGTSATARAKAKNRSSSANQETYLGANVFTPDDVFAADYSGTSVDAGSPQIIANIAALTQSVDGTTNLEENGGEYAGKKLGYAINFNVADSATRLHKVGMYAAPGGTMPWQKGFLAEPCCGDHHGLVFSPSEDAAWEAYDVTFPPLHIYGQGRMGNAAPGHYWNLNEPLTSQYPHYEHSDGANASDTPYVAGALLGDRDCCNVTIDHAMMLVGVLGSDAASDAYLRPASGPVSNDGACDYECASTHVVYSDHFRLHASFALSCSPACPEAQSIVTALKKYGAFLTDGAAEWSIIIGNSRTGAKPFQPWNVNDVGQLSQIKITDFDILDRSTMGGLICLLPSGSC